MTTIAERMRSIAIALEREGYDIAAEQLEADADVIEAVEREMRVFNVHPINNKWADRLRGEKE